MVMLLNDVLSRSRDAVKNWLRMGCSGWPEQAAAAASASALSEMANRLVELSRGRDIPHLLCDHEISYCRFQIAGRNCRSPKLPIIEIADDRNCRRNGRPELPLPI